MIKIQLSILFILIAIIFIIRFHKKKIREKVVVPIDKNEQTIFLFLQYLDRYFITNKVFTFICTILFIIGNISIFFILRLLYKSNLLSVEHSLFEIANDSIIWNYTAIFYTLGYLFLSLIIVIFYKMLLNALFYDEIIKFHLYFQNTKWYEKISNIFVLQYITEFFGSLYLFFHNISKLRIITSLNIEDTEDVDCYSYIYDNATIENYSRFCVNLAEKYKLFLWIVIMLRKCFRGFYIHFRFDPGLVSLLPYFIFFNVSFYAFINMKTYYLPYAIFILYIVNLIMQYGKFCCQGDSIFNGKVFNYFYDNTIAYKEQHLLLKTNPILFMKNFSKSKINNTIFAYIKIDDSFVNYILNNNFENKKDYKNYPETKKIKDGLTFMYKRWLFLTNGFIVLCYILLNINNFYIKLSSLNISINITYILTFLYIVIFICSKMACKYTKPIDGMDFDWSYYKFNKSYNIIFWILMLIQIIIYIIFLLMNNIVFYDETILKKWGIKLKRYFTIEEKIKYFDDCFEIFIQQYDNKSEISKKVLSGAKLFKEELNISDMITENTKLKDLRLFTLSIIKLFEDSCFKIYIKPSIIYELIITIRIYIYSINNEIIDGIIQRRALIREYVDPIVNLIVYTTLKITLPLMLDLYKFKIFFHYINSFFENKKERFTIKFK